MLTIEDVLEKILQEDIVDETDAAEPGRDNKYRSRAHSHANQPYAGTDFSEKKLVLPSHMVPAGAATAGNRRVLGNKVYETV
jgi:Mg2+/Co2+ transporter CorC